MLKLDRDQTFVIVAKNYTKVLSKSSTPVQFCFLYFLSNILFKIVCEHKFLFITRPNVLQTSLFWSFYDFQTFLKALMQI